jgi:hypothetical protein
MASQFRPARSFQPKPVKVAVQRPMTPGAIVDAVLRFHDLALDQGGDRTLLRLSEERLATPEVKAALGDMTRQAGGVSILWNEREGEIIRVLAA